MTRYNIVQADLERDRQAIIDVWQRNFPAHDAHAHGQRLDWYYRQNPAGPGRCWLLLSSDRVIGTAGLGLRRVRIGGQSRLVGIASDLAVDREHRTFQPALMLERAVLASLDDGLELIYGLPNDRSMPIFRRLGYQPAGALLRYAKLLRVERYLPRYLAPAALPINLLLRFSATWRRSQGHSLRGMGAFDKRFDELWERVADRFDMVGERDTSFLRWRYLQYPLQRYFTTGLLTPDERQLLGYATYYLDDRNRAVVADVIADSSRGALDDLIAGLIRDALSRGAAAISCEAIGASRLADALCRLGFRPRSQEATLTVYGARPDNWYFMRGDEDYN